MLRNWFDHRRTARDVVGYKINLECMPSATCTIDNPVYGMPQESHYIPWGRSNPLLIYQSLTPSPFLRVFCAKTLLIDDDEEGDEEEYRRVFPVFQGTPSDGGGEAKTETKASEALRAMERERNRRTYVYARVNDEGDDMICRGRGVYRVVGTYLGRFLWFSFYA